MRNYNCAKYGNANVLSLVACDQVSYALLTTITRCYGAEHLWQRGTTRGSHTGRVDHL